MYLRAVSQNVIFHFTKREDRRKLFFWLQHPIENRSVYRVIQRLRFVYLYSVVFIIIWLPTGFGVFIYTLLRRTGRDYSMIQLYLLAFVTINYTYLIVSPVLFVLMNEDVPRGKWCRCKCASQRESVSDVIINGVVPVDNAERCTV